MNKICTSIKQSQKLIELCINISTADMDYIPFANDPKNYDCVINLWNNEHEDDWIPTWSLTALLNMIGDNLGLTKDYNLWTCYNNTMGFITKRYKNPLDAVFEMIVWLKENKKI